MRTTIALVLLLAAVGCRNEALHTSVERLNACVKALNQKHTETAIHECEESVKAVPENHAAWYALGGAYKERKEWKDAADAFGNALKYRENDPMYHTWRGIALYEAAVDEAKKDQAKRENKKPEEVTEIDLKGVNFDPALLHLQQAIKLNSEIWRPYYYLGKIYREQDKSAEAAEAFTQAIRANPRDHGPYVALANLYRQWDYQDQSIQVASQGVVHIAGQIERSQVNYTLGMALTDKGSADKAIEAFGKAIEDKRDNYRAKFQRGRLYYDKGDFAKAKKDLEEYSKAAGLSDDFEKQIANRLLLEIAAKR